MVEYWLRSDVRVLFSLAAIPFACASSSLFMAACLLFEGTANATMVRKRSPIEPTDPGRTFGITCYNYTSAFYYYPYA